MLRPVLCINADYSPMKILTWERGVELLMDNKVIAVESYAGAFVRSESLALPWPAVVSLRRFRVVRGRIRFSARNVKARDAFTCFPAGTRVLMADGSVQGIENVKVGSRVIDAYGEPQNVLACGSRKVDAIASAKLRGAAELLRLTPDHRVLDSEGHFVEVQSKPEYMVTPRSVRYELPEPPVFDLVGYVSKLTPEKWLRVQNGRMFWSRRVTEVGLPTSLRITPDTAYLMGLFCAEGSAGVTGIVNFAFHAKEESTLGATTLRILQQTFGLFPTLDVAGNRCNVRACSLGLAMLLRSLVGVGDRKRVPYDLIGPYHVDFLRGLFDGDGCTIDRLRRVQISLIASDLINGAEAMLWGIGIFPTRQYIPARTYPGPGQLVRGRRPTWSLVLNSDNYYRFRKVVDSEPSDLPTQKRIFGNENFIFRRVEDVCIEQCSTPTLVYDIEVENSHSFIANGYAVHNCGYCGVRPRLRDGRPDKEDLTLDHVIPRAQSKHGAVYLPWSKRWVNVTCWENSATACRSCNAFKADRSPQQAGMTLRVVPRIPTQSDVLRMTLLRVKSVPQEWEPYLPSGWRATLGIEEEGELSEDLLTEAEEG